MKPPLSALLAFVTVADRLGFSAAARELGVSPSALSQQIRGLEEAVGVPLFVRTTRSVALTEAGRRLHARVGPALRESLEALEEAASDASEVHGTLRLTVGRVAAPLVLAPLVGPLLAAHPQLSVEVSIDDRFVDIVAEGFDAGVRLAEALSPDMVAVRLTPPFRLLVAGSPAYFRRHGRPRRPRDLLEHECLVYRQSTDGRLYAWEFERRGREEAVAVRGRLLCRDAAFMISMARAGLGLVYMIEQELAPHVASGELEVVLEDHGPRVPGFFLYFPRRARDQPKIRAFLAVAQSLGMGR
jgi:DNA-binding transcriptional LysR family regulator